MKVDYLRISVTDRCNLRCLYCNPLGGRDFIEHDEILRFEEICRIVGLFVKCGIKKIRVTGGEPLVRKNITHLIAQLAAIEGVEDLSLTTNGVLLESMADELKAAGLKRVNISLDSCQGECFRNITGFDLLNQVIKGVHVAIETDLMPVKINSVIIKGVNTSQILPLAKLSIDLPVTVRFIEYCPTAKFSKLESVCVSSDEIRRIIEREFGTLSNFVSSPANGPACGFKIKNALGAIGFIGGRTSMFCNSCNRVRLTSDGKVKPCLYSSHEYDLKKLLRSGADDTAILGLLEKIIGEKSNYTKLTSPAESFSMQKIGG